MEKNWIKLFNSTNFYQAELLKQALIENGIDAVVMNRQDTSYGLFGQVEVYIHQDNFSVATELMISNLVNEITDNAPTKDKDPKNLTGFLDSTD